MLNIAYTFAPKDEAGIAKVAQQLHQSSPSEYRTGVNSVAHVSLTHIEGEEEEACEMWQKLLDAGMELEQNIVLKNFVVDVPWQGRVYSSFALEGVGELARIQKNIMRIFDGREVFNGYGADFEPHVTTSCHLDLKAQQKLPAFKPPFRRCKVYLTLGTRDSYGRMERVLKGGYKG